MFARQNVAAPRPFTLTRESPPIDETSPYHAGLVRTVLSHAGLSTVLYRTETLERRIPACLRLLRAESVDDARRRLREDRDLMVPAVSSLLLGVTSFFRDKPVFDQLSTAILPMLARQRPFIRIWSIGCSEGAEVYSLAILLAELGIADRSYILGLDVRPDAIEAAKSGRVPAGALAHVPESYREKYFIPPAASGEPYRIRTDKLPKLGWWTQNALKLSQAGVWDMILCRNMAMYLAPPAAHGLWNFILNALRPGGILVTGRAERPHPANRAPSLGPCIFQLAKGTR